MMMFGDRKKMITGILASKDANGKHVEVEAKNEKNFDPKMEAHRAIAESLHRAIESKSIDGIAGALKDHYDLIKAGDGDEEKVES